MIIPFSPAADIRMADKLECMYCTADFVNKSNMDRHMRRFHSNEESSDGLEDDMEEDDDCEDDDCEDDDCEDEVEDDMENEEDPWPRLLRVVYDDVIQKDGNDATTAKSILASRSETKKILAGLRHEVKYITNMAMALENDELYQNLKRSKEKMERNENYTAEEAMIVAWKNRSPSIKAILEDNINLLYEALGECETSDDEEEEGVGEEEDETEEA
ncbi:MAG: hypothetical protein GY816_04235 [Cytophagales bacterium]|nr:hypothetical protein [Cytophagales bacterium]